MSDTTEKPKAREMTLLLCLREYRHMLAKDHNQLTLVAECSRCQELAQVDSLIAGLTGVSEH